LWKRIDLKVKRQFDDELEVGFKKKNEKVFDEQVM